MEPVTSGPYADHFAAIYQAFAECDEWHTATWIGWLVAGVLIACLIIVFVQTDVARRKLDLEVRKLRCKVDALAGEVIKTRVP